MRCNGNHLRIMKWIEEDGVLNRPRTGEEYSIRVESCYCRRYYRLNEMNRFCVEIDALGNEEICVFEDQMGENVRYQIDGIDKEDGCVDFSTSDFHEVYIINKAHPVENKGTLRLKKQVFNSCGEQIDTNIPFTIEIVGDTFTKEVVLNENNQYETMVTSLPYGMYEVREMDLENFDTMYEVNGVESANGTINIQQGTQEMYVNNYQNDGLHLLRIDKWIQKENGLEKPKYPSSYDILLQDQYALREYTLECKNHYTVSIEGNRYDCFSIEEINADNVIYEVDGVMMDRVEVCMDKDHEVRIINRENIEEYGRVYIQKWIEEEGRLHLPSAQESFLIKMDGYSDIEYTLNQANRFKLSFDDVSEGDYQIIENSDNGYNVSYEIDGMSNMDGKFHVSKGDAVRINIMNHKQNGQVNNIHIEKRIADENGDLLPVRNGRFEIEIKGNDETKRIVLDANNQYEMDFYLRSGWYSVKEINPQANVQYRLDGIDQGDTLMFYVDTQKHDIIVVNMNKQINYIL